MANVIVPAEHRAGGNGRDKTATIYAPDGSLLDKPIVHLDPGEAQTLKEYRKFLNKYHLREAVFCDDCFAGNRSDGTRFHVTPSGVMIECRCRTLLFSGLM